MYKLALILSLFISPGFLFAQDATTILNSKLTKFQKADTLLVLAGKEKSMGNFKNLGDLLRQAKPLIFEVNDPDLIIKYYSYSGSYYESQEDDKDLIVELKNAIPHFSKGSDLNLQASCLFFIGRGYRRLRQFDSAHHYLDLTEKKFDQFNPYRNWYVFSERGMMYMATDNFPLAEEYFNKAYTLTKSKGIRMDHGVMLVYLLDLYSYSKQPGKYATVLAEEIDFASKRKSSISGSPVHDMVYANLEAMSLQEKIHFLDGVKNTLFTHGDLVNAAYTNSMISALYEDSNQPQLSLPYMKESMEMTRKSGNLVNHYIYTKATYRLLIKAGSYNEAAPIFDYLLALKDSITNTEQQKMIDELDVKYQTEKKQKEIELLNTQNKLDRNLIALLNTDKELTELKLKQESEKRTFLIQENILKDSVVAQAKLNNELLSRENDLKQSELLKEQALSAAINRENELKSAKLVKEKNLSRILIIGTALILLAGGIILFQYRRQKTKNLVIQKQSDDLQILMKEIHHRVKNNLQVISSLLDLQSMTIADNQASEAVREGKNRVQSMALIHQNLYSDGNIKGIKTKEYINNLLQSLCDSYNITNEKVKITTQIDDLNLDVDTMIPLGLVLNELVSNSLKYAFKDMRQGELSIEFKKQPEHLLLKVSDNGTGYPEGMNAKEGKSFGMKMIRAFAQKLKAKLDIYNNNGAVVEMKITKYQLA